MRSTCLPEPLFAGKPVPPLLVEISFPHPRHSEIQLTSQGYPWQEVAGQPQYLKYRAWLELHTADYWYTQPPKHGWYSAGMDERVGSSTWETLEGKPVHVTTVTESATSHGTQWEDIQYVGEVRRPLEANHRLDQFKMLHVFDDLHQELEG